MAGSSPTHETDRNKHVERADNIRGLCSQIPLASPGGSLFAQNHNLMTLAKQLPLFFVTYGYSDAT